MSNDFYKWKNSYYIYLENLVLGQMPHGYKLFVQYKYSKKITPKELPMTCRTIKDGEECTERTDIFVYGMYGKFDNTVILIYNVLIITYFWIIIRWP